METKVCTKCGKTKPLSEFHKHRGHKDGYRSVCKVCANTYAVEYRKKNSEILSEKAHIRYANDPEKDKQRSRKYRRENKDKVMDMDLRYRYNISLGDYDEMLEAQGGVCWICGMTISEHGKRLYVDHNHETGEVRGLLCESCNFGLGKFKDNPELLARAIQYLSSTRE